jgi:hypothetical protein
MKAITMMFESILSDETIVVWSDEQDMGACAFAGPRIQTVWGWGT